MADDARVDRLIADIHAMVFATPIDQFKEAGLQALRGAIGFDAGLWGTGEADAGRIYSIATVDYPLDRLLAYASQWQEQDFVRAAAVANPGRAFRNEDVMAREAYCETAIYRDYSGPAGIEHALGIVDVDPITRVGEMLFLFRADPAGFYTDAECRQLERLMPHFVNAWRHRQLLHLHERYRRPPAELAPFGIAHAVVDSAGQIHAAEPEFGAMVRRLAPDWTGPLLPEMLRAALAQGQGLLRLGTLQLVVHGAAAAGDRFVLAASVRGAAPSLSPAEMRVAQAYAAGLSATDVAATLGVSPRTVRNQLASVYQKLDVHDRLALIDRLSVLAASVEPPITSPAGHAPAGAAHSG